MICNRKFEILPQVYNQAFRDDVNFRYHLKKSMIITVLLFSIGFICNSLFNMGLDIINNIVFIIIIAATCVNACIEFIFPKIAYKALKREGKVRGYISLEEDNIYIKFFDYQSKIKWTECAGIIQNENAFIIYVTGGFFVLPKSIFDSEEERSSVENFLEEKGNQQRSIYFLRQR